MSTGSIFITMGIKNFLLRKKRKLSSNSADGDDRKRSLKAPSFDDSIFKAANNGEVFEEALKPDDWVANLWNCMKNLEEKMLSCFKSLLAPRIAKLKANWN